MNPSPPRGATTPAKSPGRGPQWYRASTPSSWTPEYNHSTSAALKNALDYLYPEWADKAAAFVGNGIDGGTRGVEHLRAICAELAMAGDTDHRGSLAKCGPRYLRWALIEAAVHGARHQVYQERYQRTARRLGRQRGTKIARVDIARRMAESIWHMLTTAQPFAPAGAAQVLAA